jgi:hypothetical protein
MQSVDAIFFARTGEAERRISTMTACCVDPTPDGIAISKPTLSESGKLVTKPTLRIRNSTAALWLNDERLRVHDLIGVAFFQLFDEGTISFIRV